jgi:hypothetical protein
MRLPPIAGESVMYPEKKMGKFELYEVEIALDTLLRADQIGKDKDLMKQVMILAKRKDTSMVEAGLIKKQMKR